MQRAVIFSLLILATGLSAQEPELGSTPPAGAWPVEGGSPSRTGTCAYTPPLTEALQQSWKTNFVGTIESEPLVWGDQIFLSEKLKNGSRQLTSLSLRAGQPAYRPVLFKDAVGSLIPTIWGEHIVVRSAPSAFQFFRRTKTLTASTRHNVEGVLLSLVLHDGSLFVLSTRSLSKWDPKSRKAIWKEEGLFRGSLSMRGDHLYVLGYDGQQGANLLVFNSSDGSKFKSVKLGAHGGKVPVENATATIVVSKKLIAVHHALPLLWENGVSTTGTILSRDLGTQAQSLNIAIKGHVNTPVPLFGETDLYGILESPNPEFGFLQESTSEGGFFLLADAGRHSEFLEHPVPGSRAGNVVYHGARSFIEKDGTILWKGPDKALFRPVPVRESLLLVTAENRLESWGRASTADAAGTDALSESAATGVSGGVAVLADGTVLSTGLEYDPANKSVKADRSSYPVEQIAMIVAANGAVIHMRSPSAVFWGLDQVIRDAYGKGCLKLVDDARRAGEMDLASELLSKARENGVSETDTSAIEARLDAAKKRPPPRKETLQVALKKDVDALERSTIEPYWLAFKGLPDEPTWLYFELLRKTLALDPKHPEAHAKLTALLPTELAGAVSTDLVGAIDLAEALTQTKIRVVKAPRLDQTDTTHSQRQLGAMMFTWRNDLIAVESDQLLIVTPVSSAGNLAKCLSMGELVCSSLEKLFESGDKKRDTRYPLELRLYESLEEYKSESTKPVRGFSPPDPSSLEWTAGHFSPRDNVTRIYLPKDGDQFESVRSTYAHEIAHHWLHERCPMFTSSERDLRNPGTPCFFIVEGFATFIQEGKFDLYARTFSPTNKRADSIDTVANVKKMIPWDLLYKMNQVEFAGLEAKPSIAASLQWKLGYARLISGKSAFYSQAAATCHYLYHADDGKHREKLFQLIQKHYTGRSGRNTVEELFGMSPAELGNKVESWCIGFVESK